MEVMCQCGKLYLSVSAHYLHVKTKHPGQVTSPFYSVCQGSSQVQEGDQIQYQEV